MFLRYSSRIEREIEEFIRRAEKCGFPERDVANARDLLQVHEWGIAFEIAREQLYEYTVRIDQDLRQQAKDIQEQLGLPKSEIKFLDELVIEENGK